MYKKIFVINIITYTFLQHVNAFLNLKLLLIYFQEKELALQKNVLP